jgi:hypothetical protein
MMPPLPPAVATPIEAADICAARRHFAVFAITPPMIFGVYAAFQLMLIATAGVTLMLFFAFADAAILSPFLSRCAFRQHFRFLPSDAAFDKRHFRHAAYFQLSPSRFSMMIFLFRHTFFRLMPPRPSSFFLRISPP